MTSLIGSHMMNCAREAIPGTADFVCSREAVPVADVAGACLREAAPVSTGACLREAAAVGAGTCLREAAPIAGFACVKEVAQEFKAGGALTCVKEVARPQVEAEGALECVKEVFNPEAWLGQPLNCAREVPVRGADKIGAEVYCAREAVPARAATASKK
jgi:hypothetical protein